MWFLQYSIYIRKVSTQFRSRYAWSAPLSQFRVLKRYYDRSRPIATSLWLPCLGHIPWWQRSWGTRPSSKMNPAGWETHILNMEISLNQTNYSLTHTNTHQVWGHFLIKFHNAGGECQKGEDTSKFFCFKVIRSKHYHTRSMEKIMPAKEHDSMCDLIVSVPESCVRVSCTHKARIKLRT